MQRPKALHFFMKWYWVKTSALVRSLFSGFVWEVPTRDKVVYLTFDDGPTPDITQWVLKQLDLYEAKATFFVIGNNVARHPEIFNQVNAAGHSIGNHTHNHVNGWKTSFDKYIDDTERAQKAIRSLYSDFDKKKLFRPPYGKISRKQAAALREDGYQLIMWDVLSADFDTAITPQQCVDNVLKNVRSGSIVIFHDSVKAFPNLEYALPRVLEFLKKEGYRCEAMY